MLLRLPFRAEWQVLVEREAAVRRGPQLTEQVLEVWEAAQPRRRQLEREEGGVSRKEERGGWRQEAVRAPGQEMKERRGEGTPRSNTPAQRTPLHMVR